MKKLLVVGSCLLTAIATNIPKAQAITPGQMGTFLAQEICTNYLATGEFINEDGYEEVATKLIAEYGTASALTLVDLLPRLSQSPDKLASDPYLFPMFQAAVIQMAKNDACFQKLLADEIFSEVQLTPPAGEQ